LLVEFPPELPLIVELELLPDPDAETLLEDDGAGVVEEGSVLLEDCAAERSANARETSKR